RALEGGRRQRGAGRRTRTAARGGGVAGRLHRRARARVGQCVAAAYGGRARSGGRRGTAGDGVDEDGDQRARAGRGRGGGHVLQCRAARQCRRPARGSPAGRRRGAMMPAGVGPLLAAYRSGQATPVAVVEELITRLRRSPDAVWISRVPEHELRARAQALMERSPTELPLYGIPFAIKDNIDLQGLPTTAACPAFSYMPQRSAEVVQRLVDAGAIALGKTNLDQFATGLVGTRSPYGICANAFDPGYISGGSSSGSALAVALGLAAFALGTDTAGSGRVPAAFNNLVGYKPTPGLLSTRGVVPACRTLDTVSVFALTAADAATVAQVARGFDPG